MKKKRKKWEVVQAASEILIAQERKRSEYIVNRKNAEINKLKAEIEGLKEVDRIKDALIYVLSKSTFGKTIKDSDIKNALDKTADIGIKKVKDGFRIKT